MQEYMAVSAVYSTDEILQPTAKCTRKVSKAFTTNTFSYLCPSFIISNVDIKHRAEAKVFWTWGKVVILASHLNPL